MVALGQHDSTLEYLDEVIRPSYCGGASCHVATIVTQSLTFGAHPWQPSCLTPSSINPFPIALSSSFLPPF